MYGGHFVYFPHFGLFYQQKSGNPALERTRRETDGFSLSLSLSLSPALAARAQVPPPSLSLSLSLFLHVHTFYLL
jgi:hypothetical protein